MALAAGALVVAVGVTAVVVRMSTRDEIPWREQELTARIDPGAPDLGSEARPVPPGAFIVQAGAAEGGNGSLERPYAHVSEALDRVQGTGTIVLRAGVYREELFVGKSKSIELRAYPGEVVWFDGADAIEGWVRDGETWRAPWSHEFSSAPSYTGGEDGTEPTWRFLNEDHPFAAHPEQLWLDGSPLEQVAVDEVGPGSFAVDTATHELVLGEDPADRVVEASVRQRAVNLRSADSTITGIGFRRFAPSVPTLGALVIEGDRARLSEVVVEDSSTTGVFVTGHGTVLDRVTVRRSGMIGVAANFADGFTVTGSLIEHNNAEGFNQAPVSGGIKVTRSRDVAIAASVVRGNAGPGIWLDQSVKHATVSASDVLSNAGHGVFAEISDSVLLVDLVIAGNGRIGVKINDASRVQVWRSTIVGNGLGIAVLQDDRRASDATVPGHDERHPDDPDMSWVAAGTVIADSIVGEVGGSSRDSDSQPAAPIWVHDYSGSSLPTTSSTGSRATCCRQHPGRPSCSGSRAARRSRTTTSRAGRRMRARPRATRGSRAPRRSRRTSHRPRRFSRRAVRRRSCPTTWRFYWAPTWWRRPARSCPMPRRPQGARRPGRGAHAARARGSGSRGRRAARPREHIGHPAWRGAEQQHERDPREREQRVAEPDREHPALAPVHGRERAVGRRRRDGDGEREPSDHDPGIRMHAEQQRPQPGQQCDADDAHHDGARHERADRQIRTAQHRTEGMVTVPCVAHEQERGEPAHREQCGCDIDARRLEQADRSESRRDADEEAHGRQQTRSEQLLEAAPGAVGEDGAQTAWPGRREAPLDARQQQHSEHEGHELAEGDAAQHERERR
ncbi:right-handed parallel beta-helix repeat-containing protein [Homoserinibacter gongjuensis]|uniref:right-handed parallel beta-helix repeat-containing protein n=1 Tax=Homoserinibacter gongjuensis TaxID=1162968 RepID=UPI0024E122AE|nr:right-handed parallel beta-helix repeat-containing protein [Homoserinibacter gongjuensis]